VVELADGLVLLPAAFFVGMGSLALARPSRIVDRFSIEVASVDGRNEIRSVYGGFGLAVSVLLVWASFTDGRGEVWIPGTMAVLCLGMASGRVVSIALDRTHGTTVVWSFMLLELVLGLALLGSCALR
jgi:hypothetical protein